MEPTKITDSEFEIPKQGRMNVPVHLFTSEKLLAQVKQDKSIQQGMNVACLPGIQVASIMMPDAHQGYGFSIGGVAAFSKEEGIITPGGIGFDINCGVRVLTTNLKKEEVEGRIKEITDELFRVIPTGTGSESDIRLTDEDMDNVLRNGADWCIEKGYGQTEDKELAEENGKMEQADPSCLTSRAKARGRKQLGTLGSGNHFVEIQYVDKIYDAHIAETFGVPNEDQVIVMIHTGSRGLGHQVCSDFLREMEEKDPKLMASLPEKDLVYAKADSEIGKRYYKAMSAAANYAWANRTVIAHRVREAFKKVFDVEMHALYDVAHNICKLEKHTVNGEEKELYVHRKGATRAFPKGHEDIPDKYRAVGQPVLIPGSMGTASYILVGNEEGMKKSFGSTAHGAGRVMSRHKALDTFTGDGVQKDLESKNIYLHARSRRGVAEEAPGVYKDVDEVVKVSHDAGIANLVVRAKPLGVIKG